VVTLTCLFGSYADRERISATLIREALLHRGN